MHNNSSDRSVTGDEQITSWVTSPVLCRSSTTFALYCTACWCHMIIYSLYISSYDTHSFICSLQIHAAWFEFMIMIPRPVVSPEMNVSPCAFTHCHSTYCKFNAFWQFTSVHGSLPKIFTVQRQMCFTVQKINHPSKYEPSAVRAE